MQGVPGPHDAIAAAARDSYALLLSFVAARAGGDLAGAEDALADAFAAALVRWPEEGLPERPEAWIVGVARRRLIDAQRRGRTRTAAEEPLRIALELAAETTDGGHDFPDDRLKLLFVCAHPAIDPADRTPLSLQVVLGLPPERIASAFLVSPAAMRQRLVRAKRKIRDARIPFEIPDRGHWPERFSAVLDAIYVAFTAGWEGQGDEAGQLESEAIRLARLLVALVPEEPEALGLLSLMLQCDARKAARRSGDGEFVPLPEQNVARWCAASIAEADEALLNAAALRRPGRFQLEAAIQSVHAARRATGRIDWLAIVGFYEKLLSLTPARGARIGHALALAESIGVERGLAALNALDCNGLGEHQPFWAARADLLRRAERPEEARRAYDRAIGLTEDIAVRRFLLARRRSLDRA